MEVFTDDDKVDMDSFRMPEWDGKPIILNPNYLDPFETSLCRNQTGSRDSYYKLEPVEHETQEGAVVPTHIITVFFEIANPRHVHAGGKLFILGYSPSGKHKNGGGGGNDGGGGKPPFKKAPKKAAGGFARAAAAASMAAALFLVAPLAF